MKGFCQHCGKELNGDERACPQCGMSVGPGQSPQTPYYYSPPKKKNTAVIAIAVVAVIAVVCIVGVVLLPTIFTTEDQYTVTIKIEEIRVDVKDSTYYNAPVVAQLDLTCRNGSSKVVSELGPWEGIPVNNTPVTSLSDNTVTFTVRGDPTKITYSAFLLIKKDVASSIWDYADIYDVTSKVTSPVVNPHYYGCTGVEFTIDKYDGTTAVIFSGDSDPVGYVKITATAVKI